MKILIALCVFVLLAGCAGNKQTLQLQSPIVAGSQQVQAPVISEPIIKVIDQLCIDDQFNKGLYEGYYMGREKQIFTGQQLDDIAKWQTFCAKPKDQRTPYEYGYITGRAVDSLIVGLAPYLGKDALRLLRAGGLIF